MPPDGFSAGLSSQQVDVNGVTGQLGIGPDKVYLTWSPAPSHTAYVDGTRATQDQVLTVARGLKLSADLMSATATVVPAGLEVVPLLRSDGATTNWAEYRFERAGAMLQIDFYEGGRAALEGRVGDPAHNVTVRGTTGALRDDTTVDRDRYWVHFLDGRWAVEVVVGPFPDEASFLAVVNARRVDG